MFREKAFLYVKEERIFSRQPAVQEVSDSKLNLEEGCAIFDPPLEHYEMFWEKSLDTKMIMAWSRDRVVLAFRGTASLANVAADLQVPLPKPFFPPLIFGSLAISLCKDVELGAALWDSSLHPFPLSAASL